MFIGLRDESGYSIQTKKLLRNLEESAMPKEQHGSAVFGLWSKGRPPLRATFIVCQPLRRRSCV